MSEVFHFSFRFVRCVLPLVNMNSTERNLFQNPFLVRGNSQELYRDLFIPIIKRLHQTFQKSKLQVTSNSDSSYFAKFHTDEEQQRADSQQHGYRYPQHDEPQILAKINIRGRNLFHPLNGVSCLSDNEFWVCQNDNNLRLYNLQGELEIAIQTKSGNPLKNIAATQSGDLVNTGLLDRSINLVRGSHIQTLIRLEGWGPLGLCRTASRDLLVIMESDDGKQTKVVRYSASAPTQIIQG